MFTKAELVTEQWKDIPQFPGYQVSTLGRVQRQERTVQVPMIGGVFSRTYKRNILSQFRTKDPRKSHVEMKRGGRSRRRYVVHLMAHVWLDVPWYDLRYNRVTITFKDGNRFNYRLENIEVM